MHRCLLIPEMVHLICEEIDATPGQSLTLISLAGTCQFFKDPALNLLWATLPSILPLVKCLPSNVWSAKPYQERGICKELYGYLFQRI